MRNRVMVLATAILAGCALAPAPSHDALLGRALPGSTAVPPAWKSAAASESVANDWLKSLADPTPEAVVAEALANNLDLRQAVAAELALWPDFSLSLAGGRLGSPLLALLRLNPWLATAAIGVSVPVYEGGALRAQLQIATAQQAQLVARYGSNVLRAFREVETTLANEQLLTSRVTLNESAVHSRSHAVRIATVQYLAGSKDLLWVANLQTNQLEAESGLIRLRGQRHLNRIGLLLALGGSFDERPATVLRRSDD